MLNQQQQADCQKIRMKTITFSSRVKVQEQMDEKVYYNDSI